MYCCMHKAIEICCTCNMSPRQLLSALLISLLSTHPPTGVSSLSFSYDFSSQPHYNTKDLNLFYLKTTTSLDLHGRLHGDSTVWSKGIRSVGRVLHTQPVLLWDNATGAAASFTMTFCLRTRQQTTGAGAGGAPPRMSVFLVPYYPSSNRKSRSVTTDGDDQIEEVEFETTLNSTVVVNVTSIVVCKLQIINTTVVTGRRHQPRTGRRRRRHSVRAYWIRPQNAGANKICPDRRRALQKHQLDC